jgi:hypothetical protein
MAARMLHGVPLERWLTATMLHHGVCVAVLCNGRLRLHTMLGGMAANVHDHGGH